MKLHVPATKQIVRTREQIIREQIRVGKRLIYEQLIKGSTNEAELKEKTDTHVEQVLKAFNIKFDYR